MDRLPKELLPKLASIIVMYINLHGAIISLTDVLHTYYAYLSIRRRNKRRRIDLGEYDRHKIRKINLRRIVFDFELVCIENIRIDRRSFHTSCDML